MSDNSWYENGEIPKVGEIVEFCNKKKEKERICTDDWRNGDKLEVLAIRKVHMSELPIVFNLRDQTASAVIMDMIRPIKTEREIAIEAARSVLKLDEIPWASRFGQLYDAGLLRSKNES